MSTTLSTLRTKFRNEVRDPNGKVWNDSMTDDFINRAYFQVQSDGNFRWPGNENGSSTVTFVAGTQEYALPSDFGWVEFMMISTEKCSPTSFEEVKIRNPNSTQSRPTWYYLRGAYIGFDPVPNGSDASGTLYYRKLLADLSAAGDLIGLDDRFVKAIVKYAAYDAWSTTGREDKASVKYRDYEMEMKKLRTTFLGRDMGQFNYMVQRRGTFVPRSNVLY